LDAAFAKQAKMMPGLGGFATHAQTEGQIATLMTTPAQNVAAGGIPHLYAPATAISPQATPQAVDNPGLSRLMAQAETIYGSAKPAVQWDRSAAARKGWETRRAKRAAVDAAMAQLDATIAEIKERATRIAEQQGIWNAQRAAMPTEKWFAEQGILTAKTLPAAMAAKAAEAKAYAPKKTLFQRLAVRLLSMMGVR
jgi:hypothetical protein